MRQRTEWERITAAFERQTCRLGNQPVVHHDGITWIECAQANSCRCRMHDAEGVPLSQFLARWQQGQKG